MITGLAWFFGLAVLFAAYGMARHAAHRVRHHGVHALVWRFMTGHPLSGHPATDRGWVRPGTRALTVTGHATRMQHMPRWRHTLWRSGPVLTVLAAAYGLLVDAAATRQAVEAALVAAVLYAAWRLFRWIRHRRHHRTWMTPLHMRLAPVVNVPLPNKPESWLQISPDRNRVRLELPQGFHPDDRQRDRITAIVADTVGLHDGCEPNWSKLTGPEPYVTFARAEPPPDLVTLDELMGFIVAAAPHELILGLGRDRKLVKVSLASDSPHVALSMPTGDGKSTIAQLILAQILFRGGIGLILDNKLFSHPWALHAMPNVRYAGTPEQIHLALLWLGEEIERRKMIALRSIDMQGNVRADVGPRIMVVGEELNVTTSKLKKFWKSIGGDGPSPALEVLEEVAFVGRQLKIHELPIAQLLTAKAFGVSGNDSAARENCGVRMLGGNSSAAAWKMLAPEVAMPPKTPHPGRVQVVSRRGVVECQVGFLNPQGREDTPEARQLALAGTVTPVPDSMPEGLAEMLRAERSTGTPQIQNPRPDLCGSIEMPPGINRDGVTLREASQALVPYRLATLRTYRHTDPDFPRRAGKRGMDDVYDPEALRAWAAGRRGD